MQYPLIWRTFSLFFEKGFWVFLFISSHLKFITWIAILIHQIIIFLRHGNRSWDHFISLLYTDGKELKVSIKWHTTYKLVTLSFPQFINIALKYLKLEQDSDSHELW